MAYENNPEYEWADYLRTQQSDLYAPSWNNEPIMEGKNSRRKAAVLVLGALFFACGLTFVIRTFLLPNEPLVGEPDRLGVDNRSKSLMKYFKAISGREVYREGHGQYSAASWIINKDDFALEVGSPHLTQRYVLALIYFTMSSGKNVWLDEEIHECIWEVVQCDDKKMVTALELDDNELAGSLPSEIGLLTSLKVLNFRDNQITGTVPNSWSELTTLTDVFLEGNDMEGTIPQFLCDLNLEILRADCDGKLHPVECSCCSNCVPDVHNPDENNIADVNPVPIGDMKTNEAYANTESYTEGNINDNNPPTVFEEDDKLSSYPVYSSPTDMMYTISTFSPRVGDPDTPQEMAYEWLISDGNLSINAQSPNLIQRYILALLYLELGGTDWPFKNWLSKVKSECSFPGIGCNDSNEIQSITLVSSNLKGTIPSEIKMLKKLEVLDLSDNELSGTIPDVFEDMSTIETLILRHNHMTGYVSPEICHAITDIKVDCDHVSCSCCGC